jgi:DNA-binding transcriptional LysR family regulator
MLFKNYEYFLAIIEEGGVSKAAEKLFISQSSVSKYLKRLEDNIGTKLFNRKSYPLSLTDAGELYLKYIRDITAKEKELTANLGDLKDCTRGTVKVGIAFWHSSVIFPGVLPVFGQRYPHIHIEVHEGSTQDMALMLAHDQIDFAVFHSSAICTNVIFDHLTQEKILFAVNRKNPLLKSAAPIPKQNVGRLSRTDFMRFGDQPFIVLKSGTNNREITQNYLDKLHLTPRIVLETSNMTTALNMVKAEMGVTFVPETILRIKDQTKDLLLFQVDDPPLQRAIGIAYKAGNILTKQTLAFIACLRKFFDD